MPKQESPLVGAASVMQQYAVTGSFQMNENAFCDLVNLRGDARDCAFSEAIKRALGCSIPIEPNTVAISADYRIMWLGPDEWLVCSVAPQAIRCAERLARDLAGLYASVVDVGSAYTVIAVSGPLVADVLVRGCPLDLHPRVFKPGQCAQTHFFKASIVLIQTGGQTYDIVVRRSFSDYLCRILADAALPLLA